VEVVVLPKAAIDLQCDGMPAQGSLAAVSR
jgi:hypothetical protein